MSNRRRNDPYRFAFYVIPLNNTLGVQYNYQGSIMKLSTYYLNKQASITQHGFTLFEILIVLAIVAILMSLATPSFYAYSAQAKSKATIQKLSGLIRFARNNAINHQSATILCPSKDGLKCGKNWQEGTLVFKDINNDKQLNSTEAILYFQSPFIESGYIRWTALQNYLAFSGQGLSGSSAGSFIYCPEDKNPKYANALIVSFSGKIRRAKDNNHDGIRESGNTKNIVCL
jgi:type IV fimbrial biogenesis protein FimT